MMSWGGRPRECVELQGCKTIRARVPKTWQVCAHGKRVAKTRACFNNHSPGPKTSTRSQCRNYPKGCLCEHSVVARRFATTGRTCRAPRTLTRSSRERTCSRRPRKRRSRRKLTEAKNEFSSRRQTGAESKSERTNRLWRSITSLTRSRARVTSLTRQLFFPSSVLRAPQPKRCDSTCTVLALLTSSSGSSLQFSTRVSRRVQRLSPKRSQLSVAAES